MIKIDHIAVYVTDLEKAKTFFVNYFNALPNQLYNNPQTGLKTYFLSFGNDVRLEIMTRPQLKSSEEGGYRCGYAHLAFSVGNRAQVDALTASLNSAGYEIISGPRVTGDGYYESCIRVFDNLIIEITE